MSLKVTAEILRKMGACASEEKRFRREWPDGVWLGFKAFLRAEEIHLDLEWFLCRVLLMGTYCAYLSSRFVARGRRREDRRKAYVRRVNQSVPGKKLEARRIEMAAIERAEKRYKRACALAVARACKTGLRKRSRFMEAVL